MEKKSALYTRAGDRGETGLVGARRIAKDDPRIEAIGSVDELNATLGVVLTHPLPAAARERLAAIQHELFALGAELALAKSKPLRADATERLERWIDQFDAGLAPLRRFILPGGAPPGALCHVARTICRRAERRVVALTARSATTTEIPRYLNRLSDLLFVIARSINREAGVPDAPWNGGSDGKSSDG